MDLKSIFLNQENIPRKYTCDGHDVNPPIDIINVPVKTKSFVLIVDDPDAPMGDWVHWILFNIPGDIRKIEENSVPRGAKQGMNDFRVNQYNGPCPPTGTHRYFFKLYALDTNLGLLEGCKKNDVELAMKDHIIQRSVLIGLYNRK